MYRTMLVASLLLAASPALASTLTECDVTGTVVADHTNANREREMVLSVTGVSTLEGASSVCDELQQASLTFIASDQSFVSPLILVGSTVTVRHTRVDHEEAGTAIDWSFVRVDAPAPHCVIDATLEEVLPGNLGAPLSLLFGDMRAAAGQSCTWVAPSVVVETRDPSFGDIVAGDRVQLRRFNYAGTDAVMYWERVETVTPTD